VFNAVMIVAFILGTGFVLTFLAVVLGIHLEDGRNSLTAEPSGAITAGARSILRVFSSTGIAVISTGPDDRVS
jgi:hypothetical protein